MADPVAPAPTFESLARALEYCVRRPDLSDDEVADACRSACELGVAAILVRPCDVDNVVRWTAGSSLLVASTAGYPDGSSTTGAKLYEGRDLLRRGVRELDFVVNPGKLRSRQFQHIETELLQIAESCRESGARLKIRLLNELLTDDLKTITLKIARRVGADFVSIRPGGHDLELIRPLLKERLAMKAVGANTFQEAIAWQLAGCSRIESENAPAVLAAWNRHLETLAPAPGAIPAAPIS